MTRIEARQEIIEALAAKGLRALYVKGSFAIRSDDEFLRYLGFAAARRLAGLAAPHLERRARQAAWGDYATIAACNRSLRG
jgi:hypothetical protein